MPVRKPKPPSYRLHKASGNAVVTLNGRDVYLGPYKTDESRQRYDAVIAEWLARGRRAPETEATPLSVNEMLVAYVEWAESYYRGHDGGANAKELWHLKRALRPLRHLFGLTPAADFGPRKLEIVRDRLVSEGLCRSVVNRYVQRVKHAFRWAVAREVVPAHRSIMRCRRWTG